MGRVEIDNSGSAGDVFGPSSGTDNAIVRWDGTGGDQLQDSKVVITDDGAIQTTGTGGNARGANAVDLQTSRAADTQVASGEKSTIGGGDQNTASGTQSTIGGGSSNTASATFSTIGGGNGNTVSTQGGTVSGGTGNEVSNDFSFIGGGNQNTVTSQYSAIGGGQGNLASGLYSMVVGGLDNVASGLATTAMGRNNEAHDYGETVTGRWATIATGTQDTITSTNRLFAIGNGVDAETRSVVFEVFENGNTNAGSSTSSAHTLTGETTVIKTKQLAVPAARAVLDANWTRTLSATEDKIISGTTNSVAVFPMPDVPAGSVLSEVKVKWFGEDFGGANRDDVKVKLQRRDETATGTTWTDVGSEVTLEGGNALQVSAMSLTDHTILDGNTYRLLVRPVLVVSDVTVFAVIFEFTERTQ